LLDPNIRLKKLGLSLSTPESAVDADLVLSVVLVVVVLSLGVSASEGSRSSLGCGRRAGFPASTLVVPVIVATLSRLLTCGLKFSSGIELSTLCRCEVNAEFRALVSAEVIAVS